MPENLIEPPRIYNQGVFNVIELPINEDCIAVSHAVQDLLNEGWKFASVTKEEKGCYIKLTREWKA